MSDLHSTIEWLRQMADSRKNKIKKWQYTNAADQIERLQARVKALEGLRDAVVYSVEAGFKPPRILQEALENKLLDEN